MAGLSDNARALLVALCVERPLVPLAARIAAEDGGRVWLVGGAVRDACLGRPRTDADLACTGDARDLARKIADASGGRFVPLHDDPPTARVVLEGGEHDITTLRAPTIEEDLAARDLALNSLAVAVFDDGLGDLIDPAGGLADIDARLIRTVGAENLRSDPLRALRVYRFAAELDFSIDAATRDWAGIAAAGLSRVAGERVFTEMTRLLETPRAAAAMRLALDDGALAPVAREIVEAGAEATERAGRRRGVGKIRRVVLRVEHRRRRPRARADGAAVALEGADARVAQGVGNDRASFRVGIGSCAR
ncbi:hypothetical protein K8I61_10120 [bacterium]|nr:hypothetical protein [bacterium]